MLKTRSQTVQGLFVLHLAKISIKDPFRLMSSRYFECFGGCRINTKEGRVFFFFKKKKKKKKKVMTIMKSAR